MHGTRYPLPFQCLSVHLYIMLTVVTYPVQHCQSFFGQALPLTCSLCKITLMRPLRF